MKLLKNLTPLATASAIAISAFTLPATATAGEFTGNIGVYSKYLLRGIAEENSNTAVQGGLDYAFDNGFYLGYWGSNLGYSYETEPEADTTTLTGFENDFYGGYAGSVGKFDYSAGLIQYYYINVDDSNLTELVLSGGFAGWTLQAQYLLTDGFWGNSGDIYWTLSGGVELPANFGLDLNLGYYTYNDDDNDKLVDPSDGSQVETTTTSEMRHVNVSLTHPIGDTGADMALTYIFAGKDRTEQKYTNSMVMSATWGFDI
ncbi:TorF family putative porin [Kaarinaea lacus]